MHADGTYRLLENPGLPLAVLEDTTYEETTAAILPGDRLLLFSDGVVEIEDAGGQMLGVAGLVEMLRKQGYPNKDLRMAALEEGLLKGSSGSCAPERWRVRFQNKGACFARPHSADVCAAMKDGGGDAVGMRNMLQNQSGSAGEQPDRTKGRAVFSAGNRGPFR